MPRKPKVGPMTPAVAETLGNEFGAQLDGLLDGILASGWTESSSESTSGWDVLRPPAHPTYQPLPVAPITEPLPSPVYEPLPSPVYEPLPTPLPASGWVNLLV